MTTVMGRIEESPAALDTRGGPRPRRSTVTRDGLARRSTAAHDGGSRTTPPEAPAHARWTQPSPLGPVAVEMSAAGVRRVVLGAGGHGDERPVARVADALDAYFAGDLGALDDVPVDLGGLSPFRRTVLDALRGVGPGAVTTYGALAAEIGRPLAARAVGGAVGANPVPVLVPCHRVVAAGGGIGGFSAGLDRKVWLLAHEGVLRPQGAQPSIFTSKPRRRR